MRQGWPNRATRGGKKSRAGWGASAEAVEQPGAGVGPTAVGRPDRDAEAGGRLLDGQPSEVAELDDRGHGLVLGGELGERLVEREQLVGRLLGGEVDLVEVDPAAPPAALLTPPAAGSFDED